MSESDLPTGFAVGPYRVEHKLGQGGMGAVYLAAHHTIANKRAAVKLLTGESGASDAAVARFKTEAEAAAVIGHRAIVDVYDWGRLDDGRHYLIMEYLEGESFAAWLARGTPAAAEVLDLFEQVLDGLEAAHAAKVVHRDLKPENLFVVRPRHGGRPYVKILDFGIAKLLEADGAAAASRTGTVLGTPLYMAPEQCRGLAVDQRADLYAIGVILYQTFVGVPPFRGDSAPGVLAQHLVDRPVKPSELVPIPAAVEALILDCLKKDAAERPASAGEVRRRLRAALGSAGTLDLIAPVPARAAAPGLAKTLAAAATVSGATTSPPRAPDRRLRFAAMAVATLIASVVAWTNRTARTARSGGAPPVALQAPTGSAPRTPPAGGGLSTPPARAKSPSPTVHAATSISERRRGDGAMASRAATATPLRDARPVPPLPSRAERHGLIETLEPEGSR